MSSEPDLVINAGILIDGDRSVPAKHNVSLAIEGDRIVTITSIEDVKTRWPRVPTKDFSECSVLPGLIDAHVHLTLPGDGTSFEAAVSVPPWVWQDRILENAKTHLQSGVTTVRDLGSPIEALGVVHQVVDDPWRYPRFLMYGPPLTPPHGHMHQFGGVCSGAEGLKLAAAHQLNSGADGVKIVASGGGTVGTVPQMPTFAQHEILAAATIAHAANKPITAHALSVEAIRRAVGAGCDGIEHLSFLGPDGENSYDSALATQIAQAGISVGSTIGCNYQYIELAEKGLVSDRELAEQRQKTERHLSNAGRLHDAGVRIVAGSDAGWNFTPFGTIATELELLGQAGLSWMDIIDSATTGAATALGVKAANLGRLAPGYVADILIVHGDVTKNIGALGQVRAVYREGHHVV